LMGRMMKGENAQCLLSTGWRKYIDNYCMWKIITSQKHLVTHYDNSGRQVEVD